MSEDILQRIALLATLAAVALLIHLLQPMLTPFLIAAVLAYLCDPIVDRLERLGLGRTLGVFIVFVVMTLMLALALLVLVPLLGRQMHILAAKVPLAVEWFKSTLLPWLQHQFHVSEKDIPLEQIKTALMQNWQSAGGLAQNFLVSATSSSLALLGWLTNLVLIPVVTFYLLRDWDRMLGHIRDTLPRAWEPTVVALARECDEVISAFLRGQLLVMLGLSICYTAGLLLIGLDFALLIGIGAGLASIVPYLGLVLGIAAAGIAALVQFGEWQPLIYVVLVFTLSQALEGMYLTPNLVGDRVGLHSVVVIFAVMAGGELFGFTGILLALPVAAVIMVLLRHVHDRYRASNFYGPAAAPPEEERVAAPIATPVQTPQSSA